MRAINTLVPDVQLLLSMGPEDIAGVLLQLAREITKERRGIVHAQDAQVIYEGDSTIPGGVTPYPRAHQTAINRSLVEGWQWLRNSLLLVPQDWGTNGQNGWMVFSRRAETLLTESDFKDYRRAIEFPKSLLHPSIADKVWLAIARNELEDAVFAAFKQVEIAVRAACRYPTTDYGVPMMRKAFAIKGGPLTDMAQAEGERQALMELFSGAIGSYKNPHSHRTVTINEAREAHEMVVFASHLLRIVDARKS